MDAPDLDARFAAAAERVQSLYARPDNETLLRLYALYKQATDGDVAADRPGFTDFRGRAKHDARVILRGTTREDARREYVALVDELLRDEREAQG